MMWRTRVTRLGFALMVALLAVPADAMPIHYNADLSDGIERNGKVFDDSFSVDNLADYWLFSATGGDSIVVTVRRTEGEMDPVMRIWTGRFADTLDLPPGTYFGDDNLPPAVPGAFGDAQIFFDAPADGSYTVGIYDNPESNVPCAGGLDPEFCEYRIQLVALPPEPVPIPATLWLLGTGLVTFGMRTRRT